MFDTLSYIGYTLLFCVPLLLLIWLRSEFFTILVKNVSTVILSTITITLYGCIIWPVAIKYGAWSYGSDKISGVKLFDYVYLDDVVWWLFISLLFSSFVVLSAHYEERGKDLFLLECKALIKSFICAFRGLSAITLERNITIHVSIAVFVILEGFLFTITWIEWLFIVTAIGLVIGAELLNSAVERLSSKVSIETDKDIRIIKDTAAAGVLVGSLAAVVIGIKIFLSRIIEFLW